MKPWVRNASTRGKLGLAPVGLRLHVGGRWLQRARALFACMSAAAALAQPLDTASIDAFVEGSMRRHAIPGVAIAVTRGSTIAYARGYGSAGGGTPMTPDTPMYIGSTSKAFTGLAVMQLAERGRIDLDATVRTYLPWFALADEGAAATITVRHLLGHSSGLSDLQYVEIGRVPDDASIEDGVRDLQRARPIDPPGSTFHYFNPGYATLGAVVEAVSGQSYGGYLREHVFAPLGMDSTFTDPVAAERAGLAQGHSLLFGIPIPRDQPFRAYALPAGFVMSTANDMARFLLAMQQGGALEGRRILSEDGMFELHRPRGPGGFYAMGWMVGSHRGEKLIQHGGTNEFFKSEAMILPGRDTGLVVLIDQAYLPSAFTAYPELAYGLLDLTIGEPPARGAVSVRYAGYALGMLLLGLLALWARAFRRLGGWWERTRRWAAWRRGLDVAQHFLAIPAIGTGVLVGMEAWMGRGTSVRTAFDMVPDAALVLVLAYLADLVQGTYKLVAVARRRARHRMHGGIPLPG